MNISDLQFSVASLSADIKSYNIDFIKGDFYPDFPIVRVKTDKYDRSSEDYILPQKKSNRGRKKKNTKPPRKFKSNISFIVKLFIHREPKKDNFAKTAVSCEHHQNCQIFSKLYNIRIFNGGKIVCVGILKQDKSDFNECIKIVRHYLAKHKTQSFNFLPDHLLKHIYQKCYDNFEIINITSTLENYQFSVNKHINLYCLKEFFIKCSKRKIINIDYKGLYTFLTDSINGDVYKYNVDILINGIEQKNKVRINFVDRDRLRDELVKLDLKKIHLNFEIYWLQFRERNKNHVSESFLKNLKYNFLKQYIIYIFEPIRTRCDEQDDSVVNSVIFKETKNTLMVKKNILDREINFRIFGTGIINIQGGNSREISAIAKTKICSSLHEYFLYEPDKPPLIRWQDVLGLQPVGVDEKINNNIDESDQDSSDD